MSDDPILTQEQYDQITFASEILPATEVYKLGWKARNVEIAHLRAERDAANADQFDTERKLSAARIKLATAQTEIGLLKEHVRCVINERELATDLLNTAREALEPLVKQLVEISEHESYKGIWPFLHVHGYVYTGPLYASELRNAMAALSRLSASNA